MTITVSDLLYRTRANVLTLNGRNIYTNKDTNCLICKHDPKDIYNFIQHCPRYTKHIIELHNHEPYIKNEEELTESYYLTEKKHWKK